MALIDCAECGRQVSDKAQACPGCGAPVVAATTPLPPGTAQARAHDMRPSPQAEVITTQATGKIYKANQLVGGVLLSVGLLAAFFGVQPTATWGWIGALGLFWYLAARIAGWWANG